MDSSSSQQLPMLVSTGSSRSVIKSTEYVTWIRSPMRFHARLVGILTINVEDCLPLLRANDDDRSNAVSRASLNFEVNASSPTRHTSTRTRLAEDVDGV